MKKTISIFLFAIIIFSLAAVPLKALASDQERVDVLIYLIDKNINRELKGNKVKTRLMSWKYNIDNTIENLNELLSEVSRIKSSGKKADLPERSGIWLTLKDKEKNYYILSQYRGILGGLKRHIEKGDVQPGSELVDLIDKKIKEMKEMIKKREPLVLLDKMEIESRMETLKEDISDAGREDTIESIQTQLNYSSPINKEYKQEISDLKKLHRQYRRILAYNRGKAEKPNSLALEIPKDKPDERKHSDRKIRFSTYWGKSNYIWRELKVGEWIYPKMQNVSGGSPPYNYTWILDGRVISGSPGTNYRFRNPGMHYLVSRVTDSRGRSSWNSYVYNVQGRSNFNFNYTVSDSSPQRGETVYFRINNTYGGNYPYYFRWEMNGREFDSGKYANYRFRDHGTYRLKVIGRDSYGKTRTQERTFYVGSSGQISFDLQANDNTPSLGQSVQYKFRNIRGGSSPYRYRWRFSTGQTGTSQIFAYRYNKRGTYVLRVTVYDRYNRSATRSYTYRIAGGSSSLRVRMKYSTDRPRIGQTINLSVSSRSGGISPFRYEWYENGRRFATGSSIRRVWNRAGTYRVALKVIDSTGASARTEHNFTVTSGGSINFSEWFSTSSPGVGQTIQMRVQNLKGGVAPYTYYWEMNGRRISTGSTASYRFANSGRHKLRITIKDRIGRTRTREKYFNISSHSLHCNFSWSNNAPRVGDTVTFRATSVSGGVSPYRYRWLMNGRPFSNSATSSYRFNRTGTYRMTAEVRDNSGKIKTTSHTFNVHSQSSSLSFSIRASNSSPRAGQSASFSAVNITGGTAPYSVSWRMNNAGIGSGTNSSYRFSRSGTYRLTATVRDRRGRTKTVSRTFNVQGQTTPLSFSIRASNSSPKAGQSASFSVTNLKGGSAPYSVSWRMNNAGIGSGTNSSYRFSRSGTYRLTATVRDRRGRTKT
ncbi:MAG: PKD domain-containing protein, partial [Candidatus Eremiobacteraeota bacterium]|nr:PKD domain-containing protein [Candidatus Eremiobacteraeota bacterium]